MFLIRSSRCLTKYTIFPCPLYSLVGHICVLWCYSCQFCTENILTDLNVSLYMCCSGVSVGWSAWLLGVSELFGSSAQNWGLLWSSPTSCKLHPYCWAVGLCNWKGESSIVLIFKFMSKKFNFNLNWWGRYGCKRYFRTVLFNNICSFLMGSGRLLGCDSSLRLFSTVSILHSIL